MKKKEIRKIEEEGNREEEKDYKGRRAININ